MKTVSIIIPVYGVEKYIASAVQSVINQTYQNFELLIIDDESPDKSVNICRKLSDNRINIIHQTNRGLAGARNTGIRHAKGDYLAF
ncbi:MAG: glycosyltransferase family 2 protein, partial [Moorea sp. SIO4G2]|nr:glycosyltransferase family 2 protein [Moorena sp. SIO4G2]